MCVCIYISVYIYTWYMLYLEDVTVFENIISQFIVASEVMKCSLSGVCRFSSASDLFGQGLGLCIIAWRFAGVVHSVSGLTICRVQPHRFEELEHLGF